MSRYQNRQQALDSPEALAVVKTVRTVPNRPAFDDNNSYYCGYVAGLWMEDISNLDKWDDPQLGVDHRYYERRPFLEHPEAFKMGFYDAKGLDESDT